MEKITTNHVQYVQRNTSDFVTGSLQKKAVITHGKSTLVVGKLKGSNRLDLQSILIDRKDYDAGTRVVIDRNGRPRIVRGVLA